MISMRCHAFFQDASVLSRNLSGALFSAFLFLLLLAGCLPPQPIAPPPEIIPPPPVKKQVIAPVPVKAPLPPETLLVVLSDSGSVYGRLAKKIVSTSARETVVLSLDTPQAGELSLSNQLKTTTGPVIAIGIEAAKFLAPRARQRDIIFALVFNHRELGLLTRGMIGVSMLPPPGQVLRTFKALNPQKATLTLPVRSDMADYADLARDQARTLSLTLETPVVANDKELLLLTRKLAPAMGGLWLLPDNRILSREILQQVMAVCVKNGKQTIVFSPTLLPLGGLISAEYDEEAIVATILAAALTSPDERSQLHGRLLNPDTGRLSINRDMAATLGLTVPSTHRSLLQGPR